MQGRSHFVTAAISLLLPAIALVACKQRRHSSQVATTNAPTLQTCTQDDPDCAQLLKVQEETNALLLQAMSIRTIDASGQVDGFELTDGQSEAPSDKDAKEFYRARKMRLDAELKALERQIEAKLAERENLEDLILSKGKAPEVGIQHPPAQQQDSSTTAYVDAPVDYRPRIRSHTKFSLPSSPATCGDIPKRLTAPEKGRPIWKLATPTSYEKAEQAWRAAAKAIESTYCTQPLMPDESCRVGWSGSMGRIDSNDPNSPYSASVYSVSSCDRTFICTLTSFEYEMAAGHGAFQDSSLHGVLPLRCYTETNRVPAKRQWVLDTRVRAGERMEDYYNRISRALDELRRKHAASKAAARYPVGIQD